jgi:AmmeMemoRadiSam system protein B
MVEVMSAVDRPRLRRQLAVTPQGQDGTFVLSDPLRVAVGEMRVTALELDWLRLFDGHRTLMEVQVEASRRLGISEVPLGVFERLAGKLDELFFLEGPRYQGRYREVAAQPVRPPSCLGAYPAEAGALVTALERLFTGRGGSGLPGRRRPDRCFRGVLAPHIDYVRGGRSYTWAFKELYERANAALFVIIGTSHYSSHRFTLTRKNFATPLGVAVTDQAYLDRLVAHYGEGLFDDELHAHLLEHSIELEVVFLQYFHRDRPLRIVPLVVSSFYDMLCAGRQPREAKDVGRMITALQAVERDLDEPICYVISGDLAHIGPKFGDPRALEAAHLRHSRAQDEALLRSAATADTSGYFELIAAEGDARRICGLPPTYTTLEAVRASSGRLLHYDQWVGPRGQESVSFASMAFYQ